MIEGHKWTGDLLIRDRRRVYEILRSINIGPYFTVRSYLS